MPTQGAFVLEASDDSPVLLAARYFGEQLFGEDETQIKDMILRAQNLQLAEKHADLIDMLLEQFPRVLLSAGEDTKELEASLIVMATIVSKASQAEAMQISKSFCVALSADHTTEALMKLKMLIHLSTLVKLPQAKFDVTMACLQFASAANLSSHMLPSLKILEKAVSAWHLDVNQERELYIAAAETSIAAGATAKDTLEWYDKYFLTFESHPGDAAQVEPHAQKALILYASALDLYGSELLERKAVVQLKHSATPNAKAVFRLVEIFLQGTVDELIAFLKLPAGPKALELCSISEDSALEKCRILNLMALPTGRVSYVKVASNLSIAEDQVEVWVVKGVSIGVIQARLDQVSREVNVLHRVHRHFGRDQWIELQQALQKWKTQLGRNSQIITDISEQMGTRKPRIES